jgi:3-oxoacyl-[acyl-carrier protein] reductase
MSMDLQLKGRTALVAGSSRGIGRAIAMQLLGEGCRVCITGRDADQLESLRDSLREQFGSDMVIASAGDLEQRAAIDSALDLIIKSWGNLDLLVANLGTGSGQAGWELEAAEWERLFNANFFGSVRLAQASIPHMVGGGSIIFIASIVGVEATAAPLPYSAAKAALINYGKNLSRAVASLGIRVNCIAPGNILFSGGSWERHQQSRPDWVRQHIGSEVPLRRFGTPEEIAALVAYLASPLAGFATGSCYILDGGQTRTI